MEIAYEVKLPLRHSQSYPKLHTIRPPSHSQSFPWLVVCHGEDMGKQTFFNISQNQHYTKNIPQMHNKCIVTSSFGWLVLEDFDSHDCFLLNLESMEMIQLPALDFDYSNCILTLPLDDPNCHILFVEHDNNTLLFCRPSDKEFSSQQLDKNDIYLTRLITVGQKVFGLNMARSDLYLVIIEFEDSEFRITKLMGGVKLHFRPYMEHFASYLIEFFGDIFLIIKIFSSSSDEGKGFLILKANMSDMEWEKVASIGMSTIFLNDYDEGMCCSTTESGIKKNAIYYFRKRDGNIYVFDLEDGSISSFLPFDLPCYPANEDIVRKWIMYSPDIGSSSLVRKLDVTHLT